MFVLAAVVLLQAPNANAIVQKVLDMDPWGLKGSEVTARAIIKDSGGGTRTLAFTSRSRIHEAPLAKALVRFSTPADLAGVGFLQIQKKDADDERFLFLPELKRSRRIAGNSRGQAFVGTDFSYADLDQRDMRNAQSSIKGEESIGKFPCWHLEVIPKGGEPVYARMELWVRKDNNVPLKTLMFNRAGVLLKTLVSEELKRVSGRWYVTKSLMTNHQDSRQTELLIDKVQPRSDIPDDEFTVRNLEKM
jgi:outer membrane lipoprotein-sorting protein